MVIDRHGKYCGLTVDRGEGTYQLSRGFIPDAHRAIPRAGIDKVVIDRHGFYFGPMVSGRECAYQLSCGFVPHAYFTTQAGIHVLVIYSHCVYAVSVTVESMYQLARCFVPDSHRSIPQAGIHVLIIHYHLMHIGHMDSGGIL